MNGVMLDLTDYTANDESTVVLSAGARAGDEIVIIAYDSFAISEVLRVLNISASFPDDGLTLDANGNLGIGKTPSFNLDVDGTIRIGYLADDTFGTIRGPSNRDLRIDLDANNDTDNFIVRDLRDGSERFVVEAGGSVGVGVSDPETDLHVRSSAGGRIRVDNGVSPRDNGIRCDSSDNLVVYADATNIGTDSYVQIEADGNSVGVFKGDYRARIGNLSVGAVSEAQQASPSNGLGGLYTPWVYTSCIEARTEGGTGSTGIAMGVGGRTSTGQTVEADEVSIFASGEKVLSVNGVPSTSGGTQASVEITSNGSYSGSSTDPDSGTHLLKIAGDSDSLSVYNVASGDYSLVNSQQGNGIIFYDGTGGMRFYYDSTQKAEINSGGFSTASDIRLKDVQGSYEDDAIALLSELSIFKYLPKTNEADEVGDSETPMYGFSAQDAYALDPVLVSKGADDLENDTQKEGIYTVNDTSLKAVMIKAIQQLVERNAELEARIDALETNSHV